MYVYKTYIKHLIKFKIWIKERMPNVILFYIYLDPSQPITSRKKMIGTKKNEIKHFIIQR